MKILFLFNFFFSEIPKIAIDCIMGRMLVIFFVLFLVFPCFDYHG